MGVSTTHRNNLSMWILIYSFSDTYYVWAACDLIRLLREDEFGVCVWPTIHVGKRAGENEHQGSPTKRQKRMASNLLLDLLLSPWFRLVLYQIISNIFFLYRMSDQPKKGLPIWIRHAQPLRESHRLIRTPLLM